MGYMKIPNLYKEQDILAEPEVYVLEKIHGTSAHIKWDGKNLTFFSGGMSHELFLSIFDQEKLKEVFKRESSCGFTLTIYDEEKLKEVLKRDPYHGITLTVYGEAYGGKQQGMSETYGPTARFIVFDVHVSIPPIGDWFASVPSAQELAKLLGLEFVWYTKTSSLLPILDKYRDEPSVQAVRNGIWEPKPREGIVIRPLTEKKNKRGERLIAKHVAPAFRETTSVRKVEEPSRAKLEARAAAEEYVTDMRLTHVLDKMNPPATELKDIPRVNDAMYRDIQLEADTIPYKSVDAAGLKEYSQETRKAIYQATAQLFKRRLQAEADKLWAKVTPFLEEEKAYEQQVTQAQLRSNHEPG